MIDGARVCTGDMQTNIDYLTLKKVFSGMTTVRTWNETSGMLSAGTDIFIFGGVTYRIRSVIAEDWQNNSPGKYNIILEAV